ncbi:MAG: molybdopterin-dependent oxidoreductase [Clostridiales Family XIII bacterium]|nr:molybdopterin-dependent oxidoreductase [Clostridiales Family XIII bacterium]
MGKIVRKTNSSTGGPVFVDVDVEANGGKGKIVRMYPMDLVDEDPVSWEIEARGKTYSAPRKTTYNCFTAGFKAMLSSKRRVLYPLKRIGFDVNGERNIEKRGTWEGGDPLYPGYERISWEEATDIVANEICRIKREYGPAAIVAESSSHHMWGNVGYRHSPLFRFMNCVGITYGDHNPDSWEGWHWGAVHSWGFTGGLGNPEQWDLFEDHMKHTELIVFWSSDPETNGGIYSAYESHIRRRWLKEMGIQMIFIDPYFNHTAEIFADKWFSPKIGTDTALGAALCYVWITEDTYDHEFVEKCVFGFEEFKAYILGKGEDGVAKTAEWAEAETGIPAHDIRALAREWAKKKTTFALGGLGGWGGACRGPTGMEWSRMMIAVAAMQGLGEPGSGIWSTQQGMPTDYGFYFPGYAEGGISGDCDNSAAGAELVYRMFGGTGSRPVPSNVNVPSSQFIPRFGIPECFIDGKLKWTGKGFIGASIEQQFFRYQYPARGYPRIQMFYKYGGPMIGTMGATNRYVKMYRSKLMPMAVFNAIWFEGETRFGDIILPACTNFERWDISEFGNCGGYIPGSFSQTNNRVITMQQKCVEPEGESKSDYEIFRLLCRKLGVEGPYSEGKDDIDWVKQYFHATDLPKIITWERFLEKGYVIVPPNPDRPKTPAFRWFREGREQDSPQPSQFRPGDTVGRKGLQTQSGKIELLSQSLLRFDAALVEEGLEPDETRPPLTQYIKPWTGWHYEDTEKYPLAVLTPHPRFSFHTMGDGKDAFMNDIKDHRVRVGGFDYWIIRINTDDAEARGIRDGDLVKAYNDRGEVILAAQITERVPAGTCHSYESSAEYFPIGEPGNSPDRGGCVNILSSGKWIGKHTSGMATEHFCVEVEKWDGGNES